MRTNDPIKSSARRQKPRRVALEAVAEKLLDPQPLPERMAELALLREALGVVLLRLSVERHRVLALSFGLPGMEGLNPHAHYEVEEIACLLRTSRERVCEVRSLALARLRDGRESRRLLLSFHDALQ